MIGSIVATGIVVAGMLGMVWYIATWEAKAVLAAPPSPPSRFAVFMTGFWEWVEVCFIVVGLALVGLIFLALIIYGLFSLNDLPPTSVMILLLGLILFNMQWRK